MSKIFRSSLLVLTLCCGCLIERLESTDSGVCHIGSTEDSAVGLPAVRPAFSSISFKLVVYGIYTLWENSTDVREHRITSEENCGISVYIRTEDIEAATMIQDGMRGLNIDNWVRTCQIVNISSATNPTIHFAKVITAISNVRDGTIPDAWFNGDATIAQVRIPALPNLRSFLLACSIDESFVYQGASVDFHAEMTMSIDLAGCPDGKYGSSCSSDCTCAQAADCDTFTGCPPIPTQATESSTFPAPDITSPVSSTTEHEPINTTPQEPNTPTNRPSPTNKPTKQSTQSHTPPTGNGKGTTPSSNDNKTGSAACITYSLLWVLGVPYILVCDYIT